MSPGAIAWVVRIAGGVAIAVLATGTIPAPVAALAAVTALTVASEAIGRGRRKGLEALAAAVIAGAAVALPALRWQAADLGELRGIQAVLGPTVLVGPPVLAGACWAAAAGGTLAVGLGGSGRLVGDAVRALAGSLALAAVFCGPAIPGWATDAAAIDWGLVALWAAGVAIALLVALGTARFGTRWLPRHGLLAAAGLLVAVAAGLVAGAVPR